MKIKNILISQPEPADNKSPFFDLEEKYNISITFKQFIQVEQVPAIEFLKERISILDHTAIVFTSRTSIENFFRICKEKRVDVPAEMKFFCVSESYALYLQKFTTYRKRKIFFPKTRDKTIKDLILKHSNDKYFLPCYNISKSDLPDLLKKNTISYSTAILYKTVSSDLSQLNIHDFDVIAFFSPAGITSLKENFKDFQQNHIKIAVFGPNTMKTAEKAGYNMDIFAPTPQAPSMKMALDQYIRSINK